MSKHRILLFSSALLLALGAAAHEVGVDEARSRAHALLADDVRQLAVAAPVATRAATASPAYYLFAGSQRGFAIISAESDLADVLAYSFEQPLRSADHIPCALGLYLDAFTQAVAHHRAASSSAPAAAPAAAPVAEAGAPLLTTQWGQGYPYNTLCPTKGNQHCHAGCVATAMAQLLRYWQWPVQGKGYSWATDGNGETYSATLEHTYAWPAMLSTTREYADQPISAQAVAQLVYDCGLSVNMNYDTDGSGAATPVKAFYENFGYVPTSMRMYNAECFSAAEWFAMICAEIDQHRPLYFRATSLTSGGRDAAGHAFVVDGYDANGNVHVNWGWDGDFDGYYALSRMNPGGYQFTINQAALFGLTPARNGETGTPTEYLFVRDPLTCNQSGTVQKTLTFNVSVSNVWNLNGSPHTWQLSLGLFDINNQMVGEVKTGRVSSLTAEPNHGYSGTFAEIGCSLKGTYPDGDYAIRLIFRDYGTTEWLLPDMAGGIAKNAVYVTLKGSRVTFTDGAAYIATAIRDLPADAATPATGDHLTRVYDATGRLLHVVPTSRFRLSDIPARGQLIIKQGGVVRKTIK